MAMTKDVYRAFADIVGEVNISDDPATLDAYSWQTENDIVAPDRDKFHFMRPAAVLLPGSTEEVQAIAGACGRYGLSFKALSTGWTGLAQAFAPDTLILDLRRMDRILKIDAKNMYAVIEPYVTCAELQSECMKLGLVCHTIGAGGNTSVLASATSFHAGNGPDSMYQGYSSETLLGAEWVLPNGEIVRTGSRGSSDEWFCGEGPGPSVRGIFRGKAGAVGGMGVFTKCAVKLAAWPGPKELPVGGEAPAYRSFLPENFRFYTVAFPDWRSYADSIYKLADSEISYIAHRQFGMLGEDLGPALFRIVSDPSKTLDDLESLVNDEKIKELTDELRHYSYQLIMAGMTPGDLDYKERVLDEILKETGGHRVKAWPDPDFQAYAFMYLLRLPYKHLNYLFGGKAQVFRPDGTPDFAVGAVDAMCGVLAKHQSQGMLPKTGGDSMMSALSGIGGGGDFHFEQFILYDKADEESVRAAWECTRDAMKNYGLQLQPGQPPVL
ncbi:MAG: FAD-binding oxidoreductase, partial [Clostridiales bacterium]|nr:FAD-binding oxidoreductase [Clostridiales bacterium]